SGKQGPDRGQRGEGPRSRAVAAAAVEHRPSRGRYVQPCQRIEQPRRRARDEVGRRQRAQQRTIRALLLAQRVTNQLIAVHAARASSTRPLALAVRSPSGSNFSASTQSVSATITTRFITPPANRSSISAQQQPRQ